ncbi:MAG TPA: chromate resistance protein ChrB domain-containing protein [Polyangia bacterium]|nr:chromate resistance protein ChrB domain-containing protein [Polyangia bacterium]
MGSSPRQARSAPPRPSPARPDDAGAARWIVLIHALPPRPAYLRVKIGRRLQKLGAVAVKNSVYILPRSEGTREDLEWVAHEIAADGGEASLCESRFIAGLTDEAIEELFRRARERDYLELGKIARRIAERIARSGRSSPERRVGAVTAMARVRRRFEQIAAIDRFAAPGRRELEGLLHAIDQKLRRPGAGEPLSAPDLPDLRAVRGRTWVTRRGIHVDRIASAWLIRRFIDPAAKLKYVEAKGYLPAPGELRFDMFEAEFTHEGELCTFEVLLSKWGKAEKQDGALQKIAEMVHDIDLRDEKFRRAETGGFAALVTGICLEHREDTARLRAGGAALDAIYRALQQRRGR